MKKTTISKGALHLLGATDYQNSVIEKCQKYLTKKGVEKDAVKYGCAILLSENEKMTTDRIGDQGHAFGICQKNLGRSYAKDFLRKNPEWKNLDTQMEYCTQRFADAWKKYKANTKIRKVVMPDRTVVKVPEGLFQATVQHNSPLAASKKEDACHISPCYFVRVASAANRLTFN